MDYFYFKQDGQASCVILLTYKVIKKYVQEREIKDDCVDKKWYHCSWKKKKYLHKKYKGFQFSLIKEWKKDFKKRDVIENVWTKVAENLDFVENSNFIIRKYWSSYSQLFYCKFPKRYPWWSPWWSPIIVKFYNLSL